MMNTESERSEGQKDDLSALNAAIEATNRAEKISFIAPAKAAFGTVGILLTLIRVCSCSPATMYPRFTFS